MYRCRQIVTAGRLAPGDLFKQAGQRYRITRVIEDRFNDKFVVVYARLEAEPRLTTRVLVPKETSFKIRR